MQRVPGLPARDYRPLVQSWNAFSPRCRRCLCRGPRYIAAFIETCGGDGSTPTSPLTLQARRAISSPN